ncbi:hypothetical protein WICPIJ_002033 [Wickerhamomyces pijperi]|uniref:Zn(2)-C6 fungal-type domain-containing protein n=1 Tax=Wickerhamomyces pijperi TaxID=599730 RepID=A0A9P8QAF6_WICPI|nr:hypothetical protein WICPIJ_002033 [Wickerhamomyces pijperi]
MEDDKVVPMKDQNALVMGDGKVFKIQKVRQRKIHSCVPCHQRKVKCSREQPICQNCIKNNLECKYFVNDRVSRGKKNKEVDKNTDLRKKEELKQYMKKAKHMVSEGTPSSPAENTEVQSTISLSASIAPKANQSSIRSMLSPSTTSSNSPLANQFNGNTLSTAETTVQSNMISPPDFPSNSQIPIIIDTNLTPAKETNISESISSGSESLSPPKVLDFQGANSKDQLQPPQLPLVSNDLDQLTPPILSDFSQGSRHSAFQRPAFSEFQSPNPSGSTSNFTSTSFLQTPMTSTNMGQTSPSSLINNFTPNPLNTSTIKNNNNNNNAVNNINLCLPQILIPKPARSIPVSELEDFFNGLPSKERSYALIKRYRTSVHPVLPILDLKDFERQHDLFWENGIDKKLEFLAMLYPVLYAASKTECFEYSYDEITKFELSNEIHKYLRIARAILASLEYPNKFSLKIVQSVVLLFSTLENPPIIDMAILIRIAQTLNLHRDPATFLNITDASLVQLRRLLWWEIFYLDAMTSYKNETSPLIRLEEFDTSLPVEFFYNQLNYSICYLNGKFRYSLILNELTRFMHGLSGVPFNSIQTVKQKIMDLHISCNASMMNLENFMKNNSDVLNYEEINFIKWAKSTLVTYCDRSLLILQKKIILKQNILNINDANNSLIFNSSYNLMVNNKKSRFSIPENAFGPQPSESDTSYSFDDLSNNLIPASLHYLYEFLKNNNDDVYNLYNWEIRNNLPFDSILIVLTNLITDLEKNSNNRNGFELRNDIRYYLLDKTIDLIFIKFDNKKRSIIKNCFTLIRYLFQILRLKFLRNDNSSNDQSSLTGGSNGFIKFDPYYTEQMIPKPAQGMDSRQNRVSHQGQFNHPLNHMSTSAQASTATTTNCSQIAPRTMRAISGQTNNISFSEMVPSFNNISVSDMFFNGLTSSEIGNGFSNFTSPVQSLGNSRNNSVSNFHNNNSSNGMLHSREDSYKEHELQRIKSQISRFLKEERLADDDRFNNKFYVGIEKEVKELIERFI